MTSPVIHTYPPDNSGLELLAPAGTLGVFTTAVDEGADAVYLGVPGFNARDQARHFSLEEVAAMIDYGHRHGVRVYLAMNSLIKEEEIPAALELLAVLNGFAPDGIILQDLGLYYLCRQFFPALPLHASTLMAVHNSLGVKQCEEMGFKRVVLAREMTLAEIEEVSRKTKVELEVFIHGALCFSVSGLCLFSSYLGGMSGLRGCCVQPCRRRYRWLSRGKKVTAGYFFSMNDLEGASFIPDLKACGVKSIKIEGRKRSSRYVGPVTRAYRMLIDAGDDFPEVLPRARKILRQAMSRQTCSGYFSSSSPVSAFNPNKSGNTGVFLGKIKRVNGVRALLFLKKALKEGDRLRLHQERGGERKAFTLKRMQCRGQRLSTAGTGDKVEIRLPVSGAEVGDSIYKVDTRERKGDKSRSLAVAPGRFSKKVQKISAKVDVAEMIKKLSLNDDRQDRTAGPGKMQRSGRMRKALPLLLKTDNLRTLKMNLPKQIKAIAVVLDEENFSRFQDIRGRSRFIDRLIWSLPPLIFEDRLEFYQGAVATLVGQGFTAWQISNLGQLQIFAARSGLDIGGDYRLNILNSQGLNLLKSLGLKEGELAIEADRNSVAGILQDRKLGTGFTVFGRPPLFTARPVPDFFRYGAAFVSPKGEYFHLRKKWGVTLAVAEEPFSLLKDLAARPLNQLDYGVVDLTCYRCTKKEIIQIFQSDKDKKEQKVLSTFNFLANLK
ncbi:MAG: peptidase U32 family protein [Desulfobia sp.]